MNRKITVPALIIAAAIAAAGGLAVAKSQGVENDAVAELAKASASSHRL